MSHAIEDAGDDNQEVVELLQQAKLLAVRYRQLTGKPLGITGEVAEFEAAAILGLDLHAARTAGNDATEIRKGKLVRVQIKGRCIADPKRATGRVGKIDLRQPFDTVLLVLLDMDLNALVMYEAERAAVEVLLTKPGSKARNGRGSVGISQFKAISTVPWIKNSDAQIKSG
ncbi:hypothetical protein EA797_20710 [Stutzerimonas zhaodongensis]|uniref:Uncharacterized protein n=1 Tax=Stutzerimonas zhaodongensis TaxID=1176257 RepID=A0A3M2HGX0_9GAMM|nr:hypothetical protein [Stutzerimonas zhaodongensis]MCQ4317811.1 hypothetical protein [Stutzerimonas zhaodongensis]RMH87675.1 hypothetical protein EA797_20710 [Stutzerimonas zhaodongensis]